MAQVIDRISDADRMLSDYQLNAQRLQTPVDMLQPSALKYQQGLQPSEATGQKLARNVQSQGRQRDNSVIKPEQLFNQSIIEAGSQPGSPKRPPFNVRTNRHPAEAGQEGFVKFTPGPGSYSTRVSSIRNNFVARDSGFSGLVSAQGKREDFVYFTRENGGLIKHVQPLKLDKTVKKGVQVKKGPVNMGPGAYNPLDYTMSNIGGMINPIHEAEEVINGFDMARPAKSQEMTKRRWVWDDKKSKLVMNQEPIISSALGKAKENMQQRIRKQKKWHELLDKPTVPSIPPKDKQVPQGEDDGTSSADGNDFNMSKNREQVIQMIQATPPNASERGEGGFFSHKMNQYQVTEHIPNEMGNSNINTDLVNAQVVKITNKAQKKMTMTTLNEYQSQDGAMNQVSQGTIKGTSKSRPGQRTIQQYRQQQAQMSNENLAQNTVNEATTHQDEERKNLVSESMSDHAEDELDQIGTHRKSIGSQQDMLRNNQYTDFDNRNEVTLSQEQFQYGVGTHPSINNLQTEVYPGKRTEQGYIASQQHINQNIRESSFSNSSLQKIRQSNMNKEDQSKISQYHEIDMNEGRRIAGMAVEMKVNQKSLPKKKAKGHGEKLQFKEIQPKTPERLLSAATTKNVTGIQSPNITQIPNKNQQKSYNKKYEFFTKPLGPGHYNAKLDLTKPYAQQANWAAQKEKRSQSIGGQANKSVPGPGEYNVGSASIQMKQIKNLMQHEVQYDKDRETSQFQALHKKITIGKPDSNPEEKKTKFLNEKARIQTKRGPGAYPVQEKDTSFNPKSKKEQLQFFNSTQNRFGGEGAIGGSRNNDMVGPGSYEVRGRNDHSPTRLNTAAFLGKRPGNLFGTQEYPGPAEYNQNSTLNTSFHNKTWTSTIQAFGTTEKRMGQMSHSISYPLPGPGSYTSERHRKLAANTVIKRVRGQLVQIKPQNKASSVFKSQTVRQIEREVNHAVKLSYPGATQYNNEHLKIGSFQIEGGAPNNFLLMKNDRQRAPFNSTVGQLPIHKHQNNHQSEPGYYYNEKPALQAQREAEATKIRGSNFLHCDRFNPVKKNCNFRIASRN